jgi:hypothetical protein
MNYECFRILWGCSQEKDEMMHNAYIVTGTLIDAQTVALDEALPLAVQKVRIVIEPVVNTSRRSYHDVLVAIRERQQARSHQPPTREEVDAFIRAEREGWDE